jgi:hypothetical protein
MRIVARARPRLRAGGTTSQSMKAHVLVRNCLGETRDTWYILNNRHWCRRKSRNDTKGGTSVAPGHPGRARAPSDAPSGKHSSRQKYGHLQMLPNMTGLQTPAYGWRINALPAAWQESETTSSSSSTSPSTSQRGARIWLEHWSSGTIHD